MSDGRSDKVQLGCGTLILIAIIVMIFSGGGEKRELSTEIKELRRAVSVLEDKIDKLTLAVGLDNASETVQTSANDQTSAAGASSQ